MKELFYKLLGIDAFDSASMYNWHVTFANMKTNFQRLIFVLLAVALGFGVWWVYKREPEYCPMRRRRFMAACRIAGVLTLLLIVANPVLAVYMRGAVRGKVVVLVDDSKSMSRIDKYKKPDDKLVAAHVLGKVPLAETNPARVDGAAERAIAPVPRIYLVRAMLAHKDIALLEKLTEKYDVEMWSFSRGSDAEMKRLGQDTAKLDAGAIKDLKADGTVTELGNAVRATLKRYKGQEIGRAHV